ncbi:MAG: elongation factor 1-beta [Nitrososphaerota archaeon]|nr:elongation factor 1-beta [Candidatus Bathyarchaeota archaeon]MDW8048623.1 elongation factor 1-beta [Nitrososphaerota archaeon]
MAKKVLISLKIFPAEIDVDREDLKRKIERALPEYASIYGFEEEPIAFGLVATIAHILVPEDKEGAIDGVESCLKEIKEISDFQTLMVRRV